jgi:hypothetical protein
MTNPDELGFNDPTAQRLERITTGADPAVVGPLLARLLTTHAGPAATWR